MIVAAGAAGGESEPDGGGGFDAVDDVFDIEFGRESSAFGILTVVAVEGGGEDLGVAGVWQHVTCDLLDGELIVGHVLAEGVDDPIPPGPVGAAAVVLVAVGVGIAGGVEPEKGHALGVGVGGEEGVDELVVGAVFFEPGELGGSGLEAGEGKRGAAGQSWEVGLGGGVEFFRRDFFADEVVDGVFVSGDGRFFRRNKTPVVFVLGALLDPLFDKCFFFPGEGAI